ncbi:MAG: ABC transporter ATP-binding protein [Dehalococcoidia bacterium]|jgi:ABC-type multidrug transport system fused ATPase/permease subunit|nr:MAG: ATP-binding cassette, subfamily B [Chloroflexota bacterium]
MAYWSGGPSGWSNNNARNAKHANDWVDYYAEIYNWKLITRFFPFIKKHKKRMYLTILAMIISTLSAYIQPFLIGNGVEIITNANKTIIERTKQIDITAVALLITTVITIGAQSFQRYNIGYIGQNILLDLRKSLFAHFNKLSMSFFDKNETGKLVSRATSDVVVLQELMTSGFLNGFGDLFGLIITIIFLFLLDPLLAFVIIATIPILIIIMIFWQKFAAKAFIRVRQAIAIVNGTINDNLSGTKVIQSLNRQEKNLNDFKIVNKRNELENLSAVKFQAAIIPIIEFLSALTTIITLSIIAIRTSNGSLSLPEALGLATAFTLYIQRFFNPIRDIVLQYTQLQRAMAGAHRVFEILDTKPTIYEKNNAKPLLKPSSNILFKDVYFEYEKNLPVLSNINLEIKQGESIALIGPTGSGKTTIISLLSRLYDVSEGCIFINNQDIRDIKIDSLRNNIGLVFQDPFLFSGTVYENISFGKKNTSEQEIMSILESIGGSSFINNLPHGVYSEIAERGQNLSAGERQLISIARALLRNPAILVLDEATANIDQVSEKMIQDAIKIALKGRTSIVIAHRISTIELADRIVIINKGSIEQIDSHQELLKTKNIYSDLYKILHSQ